MDALLNGSIFLKCSSDPTPSNQPSLTNARWCRDFSGCFSNPKSDSFCVPAGQSIDLISNVRATTQDQNTTFSVVANMSKYSFRASAPVFRASRSLGSISSISIVQNGAQSTLTGADFSTVKSGDMVTLGSGFNPMNQGTYRIISASPTAISYTNSTGVSEGPLSFQTSASTPAQPAIFQLSFSQQPNMGTLMLGNLEGQSESFVESGAAQPNYQTFGDSTWYVSQDGSPIQTGQVFQISVDGNILSYTAKAGDQAYDVLHALLLSVNNYVQSFQLKNPVQPGTIYSLDIGGQVASYQAASGDTARDVYVNLGTACSSLPLPNGVNDALSDAGDALEIYGQGLIEYNPNVFTMLPQPAGAVELGSNVLGTTPNPSSIGFITSNGGQHFVAASEGLLVSNSLGNGNINQIPSAPSAPSLVPLVLGLFTPVYGNAASAAFAQSPSGVAVAVTYPSTLLKQPSTPTITSTLSVNGSPVQVTGSFTQNYQPAISASNLDIQIYGAVGVQVGDTLRVSSGFSPITQQDFDVLEVTANALTIGSSVALPFESNIAAEIEVVSGFKKLVYLESDEVVDVIVNGNVTTIKPLNTGTNTNPALFMSSEEIASLSVTNNGDNEAEIFLFSVE